MNIKVNSLFLVWLAMLALAIILAIRFISVSETTIFGAAESDGQILNTANPVVVQKIRAQAGDQVQEGDTLLLLNRPELDKATSIKQNEWHHGKAQLSADAVELDRELVELQAAHHAKMTELQGQLSLLTNEAMTQSELRKIVGAEKGNLKGLVDEKIGAVKKAISMEQNQFESQAQALNLQKAAQKGLDNTQLHAVQDELVFLEQDKGQLVVVAPMDGFIESVFVFENEVATAFKPLLKINPKKPNKVRGFLSENTDVIYQLGDTVQLSSMTRPDVTDIGILMGGSSSLVELPLRLRRFQTISSWGREVFFRLSPNNNFFIGEKIVIHMPNRPSSWSFVRSSKKEDSSRIAEKVK